MSQAELLLIQALVGQVLPPLTDVINKNIHNSKIRFTCSLLVSLVLGIIFNITQIKLDNLENILLSALTIWVSSQAAYKYYYDNSVWQNRIRFTDSPLPIKEVLIPPFDLPKLRK